jgi:hypothetical protein
MITDDEKSEFDEPFITDDEKSEFDEPFFDVQKNKLPRWKEIESLLKFAGELETKCDASYDSIFLLSWFQIVDILASFFVFIFLVYQIKTFPLINGAYLSPDFRWGVIGLFFLLICLISSEMYLRKIRRKIKSDLRALGSIVYLIRENSRLITSDLSDFQKIQLKIRMSRFDIEIGSSIPMPWLINLTRLFLPGLSR